jgi:outer membrane protein OmpA-like peptidoglycan-associated protein
VLGQYPTMNLEIQGHTDNKGSAVYNKSLSDRRAKAVMKYLVTKSKIDKSRLTAKGYGMEIALVPNDTPLNRALNRRVQFIRTDKPAPKLPGPTGLFRSPRGQRPRAGLAAFSR